jgi:hypothetical protein
MRIRWVIAIVGVAALAALTVTTQMPWLTKHETKMVERPSPPTRARAPRNRCCPARRTPSRRT